MAVDINTYTVSVFLLTYNQEDVIAHTLKSILDQETTFDYQLVIGEDCSTDGTRAICKEYAAKYPQKIKLLPNIGKNIGLIANYMRTIKACDGAYIAICDGDDYWTDKGKLQKQVDFLKTHPECHIVYTNYTQLFPDGTEKNNAVTSIKEFSDFEDLIRINFIPSVTAMFKNMQKDGELPEWIVKYPYGDWPTYLWTIKDGGEIGFLNEDTAVYRMDIGTSFNLIKTNSNLLQVNLGILQDMKDDVQFKHKTPIIEDAILEKNRDLMASYIREKKHIKGFKTYLQTLSKTKNKRNLTKQYMYALYKQIKLS